MAQIYLKACVLQKSIRYIFNIIGIMGKKGGKKGGGMVVQSGGNSEQDLKNNALKEKQEAEFRDNLLRQ